MANASILMSEDELCCSICLDLLKDPVTLACGHSFCMACITCSWDQQVEIYTCPQCRETFDTRPALRRNNMLAGVVEKFRKTRPQPSDPCYAKSGDVVSDTSTGDVECDVCTGIKCKAVKSCLVCVASYCELHFRAHKESPALMKHTVIEASAKLHEKICPQHGKLLEVFCRTDQKCICYLCTLDEHANHITVSAVAERAEKEKQVAEMQKNYTERILEREGYCLELENSSESLKHSAQMAVEDTERMFQELIQSIEKKCSEVTNQIRAQEEVELNRTKEHLKQVELEIDELKSKYEVLKQLSQTPDDVLYFQIFQSFNGPPEVIPREMINAPHSYRDVKIFVYKLTEQIENTKISLSEASSTPATQSQSPVRISTPATQSQSPVRISAPATQSQSPFRISTPATQSQSPVRISTPATQSQSPVKISTPATQSQFPFRISTPATQSQSPFRISAPATQSQSPFRISAPATQSQSPFRISAPATQSQSYSYFQHQSVPEDFIQFFKKGGEKKTFTSSRDGRNCLQKKPL